MYLVVLGVLLGALHRDLGPRLSRAVVAAVATIGVAALAVWVPLIVVGALITLPVLALVVDEIVVADRRARTGST